MIATLCFLAVLLLAAFQFGDNNGLNNMSFREVQRLVPRLPKAQEMAKAGNLELLAGRPSPGEVATLHGELADANCFLGTGTHGYDHAFSAKFCAAAGSPLLFVSDQDGVVYVVLTATNGVPLPENALDIIGVPGILVEGKTFNANGMRALAVRSVQP